MLINYKNTLFFFLLIGVLSCTNKVENDIKISLHRLDNIENVPDWLKLNVEETFFLDSLNVWVPSTNFQTSSLIKVPRFPRKYSEREIKINEALKDFEIKPIDLKIPLELEAIRNEQVSAQISLAAKNDLTNISTRITDLTSIGGDIFSKQNIEIRYVKYIPVQKARSEYVWSAKLEDVIGEEVSGTRTPSVVADALVNLDTVNIPSYRAQPIWFTFIIPKNIKPNTFIGDITIKSDSNIIFKHKIKLHISKQQLPKIEDYKFQLDLWLNPSSISGYYKFSD